MYMLDQPWPWFISGAIIFGSLVWLFFWTHNHKISIPWYGWIIGGLGIIVLFFAVQNFWSGLTEFENRAAWLFLLLFGLPGILLIALAARLTLNKNKAKVT